MTDHRHTTRGVDSRDIDVALDLLARLSDHGTTVDSITVTTRELVVEARSDVTPPAGLAVLRAVEDDPDAAVRVERSPGHADLLARVADRPVRLRVRRGGS